MSSYKVNLKPGGVSGRNVGVGVQLQKQVVGQDAAAPVPTQLSVYVATISNTLDLPIVANISNGAGFSESLVLGANEYTDIAPGEYIVTGDAIDDNGTPLLLNTYNNPATIAEAGHACIFAVFAAEPSTAPGLNLEIQSSGGPDFNGDLNSGNIVLVIRNAADEVVVTTGGGNGFPAFGSGPAGTYTAGVFSDNTGGIYDISGGGSLTGIVGDTLTFTFHGNVI